MTYATNETRKAHRKYSAQKSAAINDRNIKWELTFDEWMKWWIDSGHWDDRGHGKYMMCRYNDIGPYSLDNIYCATGSVNWQDAMRRKMTPVSTPHGIFESLSAASKHYTCSRQTILYKAKHRIGGFSYC